MRIIAFLSDPIFSPPSLEVLCQSHHHLLALITTPDTTRGRGQKLSSSVPCLIAEKNEIPIYKPEKLKDPEFIAMITDMEPDVCVVAAYPKMIPKEILEIPAKGCWNIHPSILPRWRGAAPIQRAILAGDKETGVCIIRMTEKMDAGEIILQKNLEIGEEENGEELMQRLADVGASLLMLSLDLIDDGIYGLTSQDENLVTLAPKLREEEGQIDWNKPSDMIQRQIRGVRPNLIAWTMYKDKRLQIFSTREFLRAHTNGHGNGEGILPGGDATHGPDSLLPGEIYWNNKALLVGSQDGVLELCQVRPEGRNMMGGADFARGAHLESGERFTLVNGGSI
jgi:methionyl-tRNA formyltransferase